MAVIDIPNAFVHMVIKDEKDRFIMRMHGEVVDIPCKLTPEVYVLFIMTDKRGKKKLLLKCLNALYSLMVASLLNHRKFTQSLKSKKFEINPYDPCVWNKTVGGKQLIICFHVDDCKVLHTSPQVLNDTIKWLRKDYESIFEDGSGHMKNTRGK